MMAEIKALRAQLEGHPAIAESWMNAKNAAIALQSHGKSHEYRVKYRHFSVCENCHIRLLASLYALTHRFAVECDLLSLTREHASCSETNVLLRSTVWLRR